MSKLPRDPNQRAFQIVGQLTGTVAASPDFGSEKNPAAVELGRLGGLKGGKARAEKMTAEEREASAKKAANARWGKQ